MLQTTIQKTVRCKGIGLHSGKQVELTLRPAPEDTGVLFSVRNGSGSTFLSPKPELVVDTGLATTIGNGHDEVATVEHLLAAVRGMGIDNVLIEVVGSEVPIMDGSSASFVYLLRQAGVRKLNKGRTVMAVKKPIRYEKDGRSISARPYRGFRIDYTIDFDHPLIGRQKLSFEVTPQTFAEIAKARTFGFLKEVEYLHANGLALGGSLDNAIVLDEFNVLNGDGLRFDDEFVRHKVLDFIGDMAMLGKPLQGHFEVHASGHSLNNEFLRYLSERAEDYLEAVTSPARPQVEALPVEEELDEVVPAIA